MPEHSLRFGVADMNGHRSESWKCWTQSGSGKCDVYLLCRRLGDAIKLSLHETGQWHVRFGSRDLFDEDSVPDSKFIGLWERPKVTTGPYTLACRVHVPSDAVSIPDTALESGVHWEPCAPNGQAVEFHIYISDRPNYGRTLLERVFPRPIMIGSLPLEGGGMVYIVSQLRPKINLDLPPSVNPRYFKGQNSDDMLNGNRALIWNQMPDGSIMFVETSVKVTRTDSTVQP